MSVYMTPPFMYYHDFYKNKHTCENKQLHYQLGDLDIFSAIRMTSSFMQTFKGDVKSEVMRISA